MNLLNVPPGPTDQGRTDSCINHLWAACGRTAAPVAIASAPTQIVRPVPFGTAALRPNHPVAPITVSGLLHRPDQILFTAPQATTREHLPLSSPRPSRQLGRKPFVRGGYVAAC